jgi:hypothetical protein
MLALVLALVAGVCLAAGWLLEQIALVYVALGVSAAGFVMIAANVWLRRRRAKKDRSALEALDDEDAVEDVESDDLVTASEAVEPDTDDVEVVSLSGAERLAEDAPVYVVAGRKRFHLDDCRLISGRATEELTLVEAQEEAFTPCTICVEAASSDLLARQH